MAQRLGGDGSANAVAVAAFQDGGEADEAGRVGDFGSMEAVEKREEDDGG